MLYNYKLFILNEAKKVNIEDIKDEYIKKIKEKYPKENSEIILK